MKRSYVVLLSVIVSTPIFAEDAKEVMRQVIDRDDGYSQYSTQTVASCKYIIKNNKLACAEKPRVKIVEAIQKDVGGNNKDSQSVMIIQKPSAERGIGFLQYDYDEEGKDSDQWMYLSALGKVKRIVAGNDNEPKTGTLFGSEFSYEDTERRHLNDFQYKITGEENYNGRDCWVVESLPTPTYARKSNYSKSEQWIDKERFLILKALNYDRRGRLIKQLNVSQVVQQNGIWVAKKMNMNNVQSKRITTMKLNQVALNIDVDEEILTQRTLTDGAFRERKLNKMRAVKN